MSHDYLRDGDAIYQRSFAIIRAETDLARFSAEEADVVVRMIHACGSPEAAAHIEFGHGLVAAARAALARRRADPVRFRDGGARRHPRAPAGQQRRALHAARSARARARAKARHHALAPPRWSCGASGSPGRWSRSATRRPRCFVCSRCWRRARRKPAAILGIPVGFVGAAESKDALAADSGGVPFLIVRGRIGGSAMTAAAVNALARAGL